VLVRTIKNIDKEAGRKAHELQALKNESKSKQRELCLAITSIYKIVQSEEERRIHQIKSINRHT
jgi:hypothetical protein